MEMHLEAARMLLHLSEPAASTNNHVAVYLAGYAPECAMKGRYLKAHKESKHAEIVESVFKKKVKHDLEQLKGLLGKKSVFLPGRARQGLLLIKSWWSAEMRYRSDMTERADALEVVRAADGIAQWARGA